MRSRAAFALPPPSTPPANPTEQLREMLKAPAPARGLPVTLTSYVIGGGVGDRVRLLISAEIGEAIERDATYHVGLLALGPTGDHIISTAGTLRLARSRHTSPSPALFTTSVEVAPGEYAIRLAAVASDGRAGSVHHIARAALRKFPAGIAASDFIVAAAPPPDQFPIFNPPAIVEGPRLAALLDLVHDDAMVLNSIKVRFALAGHNFAAVADPAVRSGGVYHRTFSLTTLLGLSAGEYEMRAVVTPPRGDPFEMTRAFRYETPPKLARD